MKPKLTLVGAGPGDPELISLKGIYAIADADVILYDDLVSPDLLGFAPLRAEKMYVGKRIGQHSACQEDINRLIVEKALTKGHVVRLKGGDPFVFGRGQEEIEYAQAFGIQTIVIPGITSAVSVPAMQGIPLTRRGVSESFWVITGTTRKHELSSDVHLAAQSSATVVILMGMNKIAEIVRIFQDYGKGNLAVAIIQNGSTPQEKIGLGTVDTIEAVIKAEKLSSPAVIVLGEVVKEHPRLKEISVEIARNHKKDCPIFRTASSR
jgi:uroporphyrin-III C-methyltransferase